ncbi:MAG: DUF4118 domain-containing protein [Acidobacteria bacterium]|nr:DUF4118 domain-containing protein [Acidobacteriota bacterium]
MSQETKSNDTQPTNSTAGIWGYAAALTGTVIVTALLEPLREHVSLTTIALSFLLIVLFVATVWGSRPALAASIIGMLSINYFFLPPIGTFTIADPENWVALIAFMIVAMTAGQLSARLKRRAEQAETARREIARLYDELNQAFEKASHAEALKQSEKLKSALLDAVTHDIRTPLTSIKGSVTVLLNERNPRNQEDQLSLTPEMRRDMLIVINEETDHLNHFVDGMIELAKIEAGEMKVRQQWDSVDEIIDAAISRVRANINGHRVSVGLEADLPIVRVDARTVAEVIFTLVDNAAKYSPPESTIFVNAKRFDGENLMITVEDEGPGVKAEMRERVFDKFYRDSPAGNKIRGTGMGLAIAKGIIEAHHGTIWVDESDHGGAKFAFTLPIGDDEQEEPALGN